VNALQQFFAVRQPEVLDIGAVPDPRADSLSPDPNRGPRLTGIKQLKSWAVIQEGEKQLNLEFAASQHDLLQKR
jgi:hypothetical protein